MSAHVGRFIRDLRMNVYPSGASQFFHLPVILHFLTYQIMVAFPSLLICTFVASHSIGSLTIFSKQTCYDYAS